jgi:hypothetical protein
MVRVKPAKAPFFKFQLYSVYMKNTAAGGSKKNQGFTRKYRRRLLCNDSFFGIESKLHDVPPFSTFLSLQTGVIHFVSLFPLFIPVILLTNTGYVHTIVNFSHLFFLFVNNQTGLPTNYL